MMVLWIFTLGECPIRMERVVFFELLVEQVFLPDLLSLLDFMILVQTLECCIFIIGFDIGRRCSLGDAFWMKGALTQFHVIFQGLQTFKVPALGFCVLVKSLAQLILVLIV